MTDTITLPRSVVEQVLDAFAFAYNACESDWVMDEKIDPAMKLIQAALKQPQGNLPEGWKLVPVEPADSQIRAAQDTWWHACDGETYWDVIYAAMLAAAPQPPVVEQPQGAPEPVAWAIFPDTGNARMWSTFQPHVQKLADSEGLTVTPLYTRPQPPRQPLSEEAVRKHLEIAKSHEQTWLMFARAIERAHGIGGEE